MKGPNRDLALHGLTQYSLYEPGDKFSTDWDKAWSNFKKQGKKSFSSQFSPNKYVTWNPRRSNYPLSEEVDPIKRTERSNLMLWTSPRLYDVIENQFKLDFLLGDFASYLSLESDKRIVVACVGVAGRCFVAAAVAGGCSEFMKHSEPKSLFHSYCCFILLWYLRTFAKMLAMN
uniref:Uncharacterized protein n=1 Tax=Chenopodium quinoa TaxID=63459 RepID=A0A803MIS0_CHEQI